jgi:LysR family glycine cleavage system transcriptional activator
MTARLPSLNGLRAFEAAARHLSFTNAASELNVTQTAISHQIRRLEEELGMRLFVRQNRALALTPQAKAYLPGVRAAFNDLRLATDRLLRRDDDHVLTVSTLASLAAKWLLPRLSKCASPPRPAWSISGAAMSMPQSVMDAATGRGCAPTG